MSKLPFVSFTLLLALFLQSATAFAANKTADSSGSKPLILTGRLEQITGPGATLPVKLTIPTLKVMAAKMDPRALPPKPPSYPSYLLGKWGGDLKIVVAWQSPGLDADPMIVKGTDGTAIFDFLKQRNDVVLKPSTIFLPPVKARLGDNMMPANEVEQLKRAAAARGGTLDENQTVDCFGLICLGDNSMAKLDGSATKGTVTSNVLRTIKPGVVEQDIVVKQSGNAEHTYSEFVTRFTWYGQGRVWAQVGRVSYGKDLHALRQTVLQGWLSPNWQTYADKIARQCNRPWVYLQQEYDI